MVCGEAIEEAPYVRAEDREGQYENTKCSNNKKLCKKLIQIFPLYHAIFYKHTKKLATIHTLPHDAKYYYSSLGILKKMLSI